MVLVELNSSLLDFNEQTSKENIFESINYGDLSYSDFYSRFLLANKPCVIRDVTRQWKCQDEWVKDGVPNFASMTSKFGNQKIPTANCKEKYYNSHQKGSMQLSEYISYWQEYRTSGYKETMPCLYLKDWHFFRENPDEEWYQVPEYFASDWLNEYYLNFPELQDDYRFVYMGPKGTWTPLHKDVFSSFSWSVNICGQKTWLFYPPDQVDKLTDMLGNLAYDVTTDKDKAEFPRLSEAKSCSLHQGPGDAVFVPSGWYHQVWNKDDTISVNHNWVNACNIEYMLSNLLSELKCVEKEISDCRDSSDWDTDCQRLLKATFGLDLTNFFHLIRLIIKRRILSLESNSNVELDSGHSIGSNHMKFDLKLAHNILKTLLSLPYLCLDKNEIETLLEIINKVIDSG